jgi:hypothetical protein
MFVCPGQFIYIPEAAIEQVSIILENFFLSFQFLFRFF